MTRLAREAVWLVALILAGTSEAARRTRSTTTTTTTDATFESRQLAFAGQPEEASAWDRMDIKKLGTRGEAWNRSGGSAPTNSVEGENGVAVDAARQFYPGFPAGPGETGEVPNPISPPILPPAPAPGCLAIRGQFPSQTSCASYLNCWDDVVIEQTCPGGLLFNDLTNVCDFDYNVNCASRPAPTPKPSLPPGSRACPDFDGRYRSSTNCSEFYVCLVGRPIKFSCPRGLVYNDILNVCDYPYNVDCQGAATPRPMSPSSQPPQQPSQPPQQPTYPPQQPTYPPQQPSYPPQQPSYPAQQSSYPPQQPSYPQPTYPPQPSYPSSGWYDGNPWLVGSKKEVDPWHQRPVATQLELDKATREQDSTSNAQQADAQETPTEPPTFSNPWAVLQAIPAGLSKVPCESGEVHRLDDACTGVVVCRNGRPQLVQCQSGLTYDKPSDSCRPFSVAKC